MQILNVENYSKTFTIHHLDRQIPVFEALSFKLEPGEFLLIGGPNGVGKSTLLRCLYRSYLPTAGRALYYSTYGPVDLATAADIDIALLRQEEIGFVTQFLRPRPRVTALELVAEPLFGTGISFEAATTAAAHLLEAFGLKTELWSAYPTTFSGGEQQKVNLARTLIRARRLMLLDEPTASLDAATRAALADRLAELKNQGVAMIAVLHHPEDVTRLIDTTLRLTQPRPETELTYVAE
ncbi:MAG TPA: ATP-binding cassette domain-containing protein [Anaerolineae bacterium]|nr:ATP-binding cassette domain-containing protein [Anaerolineae bacterium]HMR65760.1 ATP-binding cassette domain-containing protein [Anaerolineae bacterium]